MSLAALQSNLSSLVRQYRDNVMVSRARRHLRKLRADTVREDLAYKLRYHEEEDVEGDEIDFRESFDYLLSFYSIMEIAAAVHFIPWPLPTELQEEALADLFDRDVRRFYEEHYPLYLPALFRERLLGHVDLREKDSRDVFGIFMQFLEFVASSEKDKNLDTFLWFLDDGLDEGYNINDTIKVLGNPKTLGESLSKKSSKRDALDESVIGFLSFLGLCRNLDALFQRSREFPLLQSAMWHYFAYWFDLIRGEVGRHVDLGIRNYTRWALIGSQAYGKQRLIGDVQKAHDKAQASVNELKSILKRLLSDKYKTELVKRGLSAKEQWAATNAQPEAAGQNAGLAEELKFVRQERRSTKHIGGSRDVADNAPIEERPALSEGELVEDRDESVEERWARMRSHTRIISRVKFLVEWDEGKQKQRANAVTVDVSASGCMAVVGAPLPLHKEVCLIHPETGRKARAQVVWRDHKAWDTGFALARSDYSFWGIPLPDSLGSYNEPENAVEPKDEGQQRKLSS